MTNNDKNELKELFMEALKSEEAQDAIVSALGSDKGQNAIKKGALSALTSKEGEEIFSQYFIDNFKEVVVPAFENHEDRIIKLENQQFAT